MPAGMQLTADWLKDRPLDRPSVLCPLENACDCIRRDSRCRRNPLACDLMPACPIAIEPTGSPTCIYDGRGDLGGLTEAGWLDCAEGGMIDRGLLCRARCHSSFLATA